MANNTKQAYDFKHFGSTYNVEILNFSNPELELQGTESAVKNKLKKLLTE